MSSQNNNPLPFLTNRLTEAALIGMVTVTPWLFGGVQASVQMWLQVAGLATLSVWLLGRLTDRSAAGPIPAAILPLLLILVLGGLQLVPLKPTTLAALSPRAAELREALDGPTGNTPPGALTNGRETAPALDTAEPGASPPISLYPAGTRRELALLSLAIAVFFLATRVFQSSRTRQWLYGLVALNGTAIALFGLAQKLTWNGQLFWSVPLRHGGGPFGPFVNQNNAGGYLNLCLAAALGLTIYLLRAEPQSRKEHRHRQAPQRPRLGIGERLRQAVVAIDGRTLAALALAGCIAAGILCCMSRGAFLGMLSAAVFTAIVMAWVGRLSLRMWLYSIVALAGLGLVGWVGMAELVRLRVATIFDQEKVAQHSLLPHWQEVLVASRDFLATGAGLGSYRFAYAPYEKHAVEGIFYHAENCYLEALLVGGVGCLLLGLLLIAGLFAASWRLLRKTGRESDVPLGVAAVFAVSSQCICLGFDFGLYIPANLLLLSLLGGVAAGRAAKLAVREPDSASPRGTGLRVALAVGLACCLTVLSYWSWRETSRAAHLEKALDVLHAVDTKPDQKEETRPEAEVVENGIRDVTEALEDCPDDVEGQLGLANLWISLYRVRTWEQLQQNTPDAGTPAELWELTATETLHDKAHQFARSGAVSNLAALRQEPITRQHLLPAWEHLIRARNACPLVADVHLLAAQLSVLVSDPGADAVHVERARRVARGNSAFHFECGLLDYQARRLGPAYDSLRRALELDPKYLPNIFDEPDEELRQPDAVVRVLPESPTLLLEVYHKYYAKPEDEPVRTAILAQVEKLAARSSIPEGERYYLQGEVYALRELPTEAIASLTRAVQSQPQNVPWRYRLATLLYEQDQPVEAREHARFCARAEPKNQAYRALLDKIIQAQLKGSRK